MEENKKKAFDFAADLTKQLITLSTAIITITVTFSKDIIGVIDDSNKYLLLFSWIVFIISILLGLMTLMALTGNLDPMPQKRSKNEDESKHEPIEPNPTLTITSKNVTSTAKWQVWTFLIALVLTCWYGYKAATIQNAENKQKDCYMIIRETRLNADSAKYMDTLWIDKNKF